MSEPGEVLADELRYLLHHRIPHQPFDGEKTGGHLYRDWLYYGNSSPQAIRIDHHIFLMHTLKYDELVQREIHHWNRTFAPISRQDKRNQPYRIVLQLHYHTERTPPHDAPEEAE